MFIFNSVLERTADGNIEVALSDVVRIIEEIGYHFPLFELNIELNRITSE